MIMPGRYERFQCCTTWALFGACREGFAKHLGGWDGTRPREMQTPFAESNNEFARLSSVGPPPGGWLHGDQTALEDGDLHARQRRASGEPACPVPVMVAS
jgi:hypothetical protein